MSSFDKIERHYRKLQSVSKSWDDAIEKAKNKVRREYNDKRHEFREKLNRLKGEEQELFNNYQRSEMQLNQEMARISHQITALETPTAQPFDPLVNNERKFQQIDQIYSETNKDMLVVIDRHKEKVRRMEQLLSQSAYQDKKMANFANIPTVQTVTPIKAVLDVQKRNLSETISKLEAIREDIEKKIKELEDIDRKETEETEQTERSSNERELRERNDEMNRFMHKIKNFLKKESKKEN